MRTDSINFIAPWNTKDHYSFAVHLWSCGFEYEEASTMLKLEGVSITEGEWDALVNLLNIALKEDLHEDNH